jgi:hypothetical protein
MTALGVNVSSRDHVYGWEAVKPTHRRIDIQLLQLREKADELNEKIIGFYGENLLHQAQLARNSGRDDDADAYYAELRQLQDDYGAAEKAYHLMATCKHEHATQTGSRFFDGEPVDDIRWVCDACGKVLD